MSDRIVVTVERPVVRIALGSVPQSGGGGSSDHTTLSNLPWTSSGHTGTASRLAGFSGAGAATHYAIGTDVAAYDAGLASLATVDTAADLLPYTTAANTWTSTTITAAGRALIDDANASAQRTTLGLAIGTDVQAWDADLDALAALSNSGLIARTGAGSVAARTLTAPAAGIGVANGDGVSGNPTLSLANDLAALEGLGSTGIAVRSAADTWVQRSIAGTSPISVSNGDGVSGNPTVSVSAASDSASGVAELATPAEVRTGTDTGRVVTPEGVAAVLPINHPIADGATSDIWWCVPFPAGSTGLSTLALTTNVCRALPLTVWRKRTLEGVAVNVTSAVAGTYMRVALYEAAANGSPNGGTLIQDFGELNLTTTGVKSITGLSQVLSPGKLYYIVTWSTSTSTCRALALAAIPATFGMQNTLPTAPYTHWSLSSTYTAGVSTLASLPGTLALNTGQFVNVFVRWSA